MENGNAFPSGVSRDTLPQDFPAGMRVLVVEDDPNDLEDLTQILERCGYKGTWAAILDPLASVLHVSSTCSCEIWITLYVRVCVM